MRPVTLIVSVFFLTVILSLSAAQDVDSGTATGAAGSTSGNPVSDGGSVYVIPLRSDVDRSLGVFLGRSLETARKAGATTIIFEIDTFGGRVDTALEIASKIGAAAWAKTIAYIPADSGGRGVSWSAGALMAFSCSELWMAPGTSMGAAAPVYQTAEGMQAAEEKTVSAVRGQMAALAEKNGYPMSVALAMVDSDVILKEIIRDDVVSLATSEDIAALERADVQFTIGRTVSDAGKLLTLTAGEMERYGVSQGTVSTREQLVSALGYDEAVTVLLDKSSADSLITFLTSGVVTSILLVIGLVALYFEITSPGFGIPGTIALISFAVVFGSSGLMGNLGSLEILIFLIGVVLLLLEIFIIPGFGVAGIAGIVLILASLVFSLQDFYLPQFDWQWGIVRRSLTVVGSGVIGGIVLVGVVIATMPRASIFDRLVLHGPGTPGYAGEEKLRRRRRLSPGAGERAGAATAVVSTSETVQAALNTIRPGIKAGDEGEAITDLRPVGKVRLSGRTVVVETEGEYYDKGTIVKVLQADGVKIIVAAKEKA